jgi:hypothetical protein
LKPSPFPAADAPGNTSCVHTNAPNTCLDAQRVRRPLLRLTIAQRFNAGSRSRETASPVRDGRNTLDSHNAMGYSFRP